MEEEVTVVEYKHEFHEYFLKSSIKKNSGWKTVADGYFVE